MLLKASVITEAQLKTALDTQKELGGKLSVILIKLRIVSEEKLAQFFHDQLKLPLLGLKELMVSPKVSALLDLEVLEKNQVVPIRRTEDTLVLAVADPTDYNAIDEVRFLTGLRTDLAVTSRSNIQKAIDYYFHARPCKELQDAEAEARSKGTLPAADAKGGAPVQLPPAQVLQALVDVLIDKKIITKDELAAKVRR
jgi:type IV pilus assembly protein PilB